MDDWEYFERIEPIAQKAARYLCAKQKVSYTATYSVEDLTQELIVCALKKREKLEPRLEAGEEGYVFTALRNDGRDALEAERKHRKNGNLEDLEGQGLSQKDRIPGVSKSADPPTVRLERSARQQFETAFAQWFEQRAMVAICWALMDELEGLDAEILSLKIGSWGTSGGSTASIAKELGIGESTVRRRWAKVRERAEALLAQGELEAS